MSFLTLLFVWQLFFGLIACNYYIKDKASQCEGLANKTVFNQADYCDAFGPVLNLVCYQPNNTEDQYLWGNKTNLIIEHLSNYPGCTSPSPRVTILPSVSTACFSTMYAWPRSYSMVCESDFTSQFPSSISSWIRDDIALALQSSLPSTTSCPSSQSLFNPSKAGYQRRIMPLHRCASMETFSGSDPRAVKHVCVPSNNTRDPPQFRSIYYSDKECQDEIKKIEESKDGCMMIDDVYGKNMARIQCRLGGIWTNDLISAADNHHALTKWMNSFIFMIVMISYHYL